MALYGNQQCTWQVILYCEQSVGKLCSDQLYITNRLLTLYSLPIVFTILFKLNNNKLHNCLKLNLVLSWIHPLVRSRKWWNSTDWLPGKYRGLNLKNTTGDLLNTPFRYTHYLRTGKKYLLYKTLPTYRYTKIKIPTSTYNANIVLFRTYLPT